MSAGLAQASGPKAREAVVFIHWGSWGDLYVASAALKETSDAFPGSPLYVVGSDKWLQILSPAAWPALKGIVATDDGRQGDLWTWSANKDCWQKAEPQISLVAFYRSAQATFNIRTESLRFGWAPWFAGVPRRHGSAPGFWGWLLYTHRAPWLGKDPVIHERDRMLEVIEAPDKIGLLAKKWASSTGLPAMKRADPATAERFARAKFGRYWLVNPTSSRREKAWPSERFRELCERLAPRLAGAGLELRILGAPWETEWLREVVPAGEDPARWVVQPPTIQELLDVLGGAQLLVTNTSSVQFLSPGLDVRTLTLMGRANPKIWGPLGPRDLVVRGTQDPALAHDIFAQEREAYRSISVDEVFRVCSEALGEADAAGQTASSQKSVRI